MDLARPSSPQKLLTLQEAALKLGVSVELLLKWNVYHILKPTITQTGEIAYTQEQIETFLAIRQPVIQHIPEETFVKSESFSQDISEAEDEEEISNAFATADSLQQSQEVIIPEEIKSTKRKNLFATPLLISSLTTISALCLLIAFSQKESILSNLETSQQDLHTPSVSQKDSEPVGSTVFSLPTQLTEQTQDKDVTNPAKNALTAQLASILYPEKSRTKSTQRDQSPTASVAAAAIKNSQNPPSNALADEKIFNNASPLSSRISTSSDKKDGTNSLFDNNNAPKDTSNKPNDIAMIIGGANIIANGTSLEQTNTNLRNQFILLSILGAVGISLYFKKGKKNLAPTYQSQGKSANGLLQKVLEIDQKMDGTVTLSFRGNVYKISKPELSSDSDRFIERLMDLASPGLKEIEYDSFRDERVRLSAPLSRLVTRLGFVGIKRDLFFPRTSKNRVLFRKYITAKDLAAMNLTTERIAADLSQNL